MKNNIKKVISLLLVIGLITGCSCNKKINSKTKIENGKATQDTEVEDVTFTNIELNYEGDITTLTATMKNNTKETKNFVVTIVLKDNKGKEVKSLKQVVEDLESDKTQKLQTGIVGDYSYIKNVEFKIDGE